MFYVPKDGHGLKHNPFKCLVAPRPIGWISSLDPEGRVNLAPFSFFNAVASDPPVVIFSAGGHGFGMRKQGTTSDHWIDDFYYWLEARGFTKPRAPAGGSRGESARGRPLGIGQGINLGEGTWASRYSLRGGWDKAIPARKLVSARVVCVTARAPCTRLRE